MDKFIETPLRKARIKKQWSQASAADRVGVDQATFSRIERGKQQPRAELLMDLARVFEITVDDVLAPWSGCGRDCQPGDTAPERRNAA